MNSPTATLQHYTLGQMQVRFRRRVRGSKVKVDGGNTYNHIQVPYGLLLNFITSGSKGRYYNGTFRSRYGAVNIGSGFDVPWNLG